MSKIFQIYLVISTFHFNSPQLTKISILCLLIHLGELFVKSPTKYRGFNAKIQLFLVEQELLTLPEHLRSSPVFSGVLVTRSLVLCVCVVDRCLSFCPFSFGHCVVCPTSIYGFWIPLLYNCETSVILS